MRFSTRSHQFWSHPAASASYSRRPVTGGQILGQAEVGELDHKTVLALQQEDVGGLDVSVHWKIKLLSFELRIK